MQKHLMCILLQPARLPDGTSLLVCIMFTPCVRRAPVARRDGEKRRPDHPDYDPGTLHIPEGWFKQEKISDGQRQW